MRLVACLGLLLTVASCAPPSGAELASDASPAVSSPTSSAPATIEPDEEPTPSETLSTPPSQPPLLGTTQLDAFATQFGSSTSLAVAGLDGSAAVMTDEPGSSYAWSTIKVVIAVRTILDSGGVDRLEDGVRREIEAALTRSDNEAAARLWERVVAREGSAEQAAASLTQVLRAGGDTRTQVSAVGRAWFSPYGQTLWGLGDQVRFFRAVVLRCVVPQPDTDWLVALMGSVVPEQRWGLLAADGAVGKGGWGPDPDGTYLVRQVAILTAQDGNPYVAAAASRAAGTDFRGSTRVLDDVLAWLQVNVREAPTPSTCDELS